MNCRLHLSVILFVFILYVMDGSTILHSKKNAIFHGRRLHFLRHGKILDWRCGNCAVSSKINIKIVQKMRSCWKIMIWSHICLNRRCYTPEYQAVHHFLLPIKITITVNKWYVSQLTTIDSGHLSLVWHYSCPQLWIWLCTMVCNKLLIDKDRPKYWHYNGGFSPVSCRCYFGWGRGAGTCMGCYPGSHWLAAAATDSTW